MDFTIEIRKEHRDRLPLDVFSFIAQKHTDIWPNFLNLEGFLWNLDPYKDFVSELQVDLFFLFEGEALEDFPGFFQISFYFIEIGDIEKHQRNAFLIDAFIGLCDFILKIYEFVSHFPHLLWVDF